MEIRNRGKRRCQFKDGDSILHNDRISGDNNPRSGGDVKVQINKYPLPAKGDTSIRRRREGTTSKVTGLSLKGETNTKNTIENTNKDYLSINQGETNTDQMDAIETYTQIVKENIDYKILKADMKYQYELLDELVEIIVDVVAVQRKSIRIGGADYPYELVKGKLLKLDSGHIRYVLDSMEKTTTHIANIKAYLLTALYNAPNTISNYYSAEVNYYEYGNGRNEV